MMGAQLDLFASDPSPSSVGQPQRDEMQRDANLSADGLYRYTLSRVWSPEGGRVVFLRPLRKYRGGGSPPPRSSGGTPASSSVAS